MADIESSVKNEKKTVKNEKKKISIRLIRLILLNIFHSVYLILNIGVLLFAIIMILNLTEELLKLEPIQNIYWFSVCYLTNWNHFIFNHGINVFFIFCLACWGSVLFYNIEEMTTSRVVLDAVRFYGPFYLTNPTIMFQTLFLFLSLSHDGLEWTNKHHSDLAKKISYWRDVLFSGLVVPYTCFVFGMFWSLYAIDRELVFPKVYDEVVPWWFNQCVHTNILILVIIETVLQPRRHPRDEKVELALNAGCGILYAIVYYSIYFFTNRWLYNVFGVMSWWQIVIFQCCMWLSNYIFYLIQFPLNRLVHREGQSEVKEDNTTGNETKREGSLKYRNVANAKENSKL